MDELILQKKERVSQFEKRQIFEIWRAEYPKQSVFEIFEAFHKFIEELINPCHFLIKTEQDTIAGWSATIDRDGGRWLILLVHRDFQRMGVGSRLLDAMKKDETALSAWITPHNNYVKIDGAAYITPLPFYLKNDFTVTGETFEKDDFSGTKIIWQRSLSGSSDRVRLDPIASDDLEGK